MNDVEIEQERLERELVTTGRGVALPALCDLPGIQALARQ